MKTILTVTSILLSLNVCAQLGSDTGHGIVSINGNTSNYTSSILRLVKWSNNNAHIDVMDNKDLHLNFYASGNTTVGYGGGDFEVKNNLKVSGKINDRLSLFTWGNPNYGHTNSTLVMNGIRQNGQWEILGDGARTSIGLISTDIFGNIRFVSHHDSSISNSKTMTDDQLIGQNTRMIVANNGNVAIYGKLESKEVKVTLTPTADFVFEENYNLPTLDFIENHIKEKKHLPEIASAEEMKENGVNIGEFQIQLLQKIEELTLYTIQQQKEINSEKEKVKELQKENKSLKKINLKLLELQKRLEKLEKN
ncbi:hypothetical protein [Polaribacter porphyrae]|uniref:Peptidase S74 domain-containing protein n=1 Tax=Polaribacter porphyrae TaxID=1137780 RepID=A0A2S7WL36_9FLAO|nr:hypothetical protein [Polaribacter porphyrae]PQJ78318.1 hypothetical protein BTO18_03535 [Polaribacter porphyrae]